MFEIGFVSLMISEFYFVLSGLECKEEEFYLEIRIREKDQTNL